MANFPRNFWVCAFAIAAHAALAAQNGGEHEDLLLDSASLTLDSKTNLIQLVQPRISQGNLVIEADQALATGVEFDSRSEWRFTGHVRISVDSAVIEASSAVFTFEQQRLSRGELTGGPASFSDAGAAREKPISGGADKITYDSVERTLRMSENAWVHKDQYEIRGCDLIYDFNDERVSSGSADCADLFRLRVLSNQEQPAPAAAPSP
jgi:lipopolysaccharide transport protein LptA